MRRVFIVLGVAALCFVLWLGAFLMLNRPAVAQARDIERNQAEILPSAGETLDIVIWNLGYGGLGAGSDFISDGGTHYFPPSRAAVRDNVAGIEAFVGSQTDADVILFQELAQGGPPNYWVDLRGRLDRTLADRERVFFADFKTRLMPWPLRMVHGQGLYSRVAIESAEVVALPAEDAGVFGVRRRYASPLVRLAGDSRWTIASVHLAAFDEDARVRTQQLRELMAWAQQEYASGRRVVIGGDWNFRIADTDFPNTTDPRFLFWVFPFPQDALPQGWRIAADGSIPSVRTNYKPYVAGENYVTTIDGFILSPNVAVENVRGFDLGFRHSDHQPVRIRVRAIEGPSE